MPAEPQPEEAATKPLAAAASAAGSYAQVQMYGRGARQRADGRAGEQEPAEQDRPQTETGTPEQDPAADHAADERMPAADAGAGLTESAAGRPGRVPHEPAGEAESVADASAGGGRPELDAAEDDLNRLAGPDAVDSGEPAGLVVSSDMVVAASGQDAAAAQARMALSQLPEPPSITPPAPGLGPVL